jgi:hypothetical protein
MRYAIAISLAFLLAAAMVAAIRSKPLFIGSTDTVPVPIDELLRLNPS